MFLGQPRYLSSLFLAGSSLSDDVSQFDFSAGAHVIPSLHTQQQQQTYIRASQVNLIVSFLTITIIYCHSNR